MPGQNKSRKFRINFTVTFSGAGEVTANSASGAITSLRGRLNRIARDNGSLKKVEDISIDPNSIQELCPAQWKPADLTDDVVKTLKGNGDG